LLEAQAFVAEHTDGYEPVGPPVEAHLEGYQPLEVQLERGYCYRMVVRLQPGAQYSEHARRGVAFVYTAPGEPEVNGGPGVHGPGAVASGGCPQRTHAALFDIRANWGSATDPSRIHELGHGKMTLQLYAKPITEEELAAQEQDRQRQIAEQEAFAAEMEERERQARIEREERWAEQREQDRRRAEAQRQSAPAHQGPVSVRLRNGCRETVRLFFGERPRFGSGRYSTLSANTVTSYSLDEGDMLWIVDESQNGLSSVTISRGMREIEVTSSCTGFTTR